MKFLYVFEFDQLNNMSKLHQILFGGQIIITGQKSWYGTCWYDPTPYHNVFVTRGFGQAATDMAYLDIPANEYLEATGLMYVRGCEVGQACYLIQRSCYHKNLFMKAFVRFFILFNNVFLLHFLAEIRHLYQYDTQEEAYTAMLMYEYFLSVGFFKSSKSFPMSNIFVFIKLFFPNFLRV